MKRLASLLLLLCLSPAFAGNYVGDYALGDTVYCKFGTVRPSTGASFTLAGSPVVSAYPNNSTTQLTAGITLTVDFDGVTGMNNLTVVASSGNGYATATFYSLQITTGTVDSVSVTGQEACSFSLGKVSALRPTTAGNTLLVDSSGNANSNVIQWYSSDLGTGTGPLPGLGVLDRGTAQSDSTTTVQLRSADTFADDELNGATYLVFSATTGAGQRSSISDYTGSTDTAAISPSLVTDPTGTNRYEIYAVSPASGSVSIATGGITTGSFASGAIDAAAIATDAIGAAEIATDAIGASEIATNAIGAAEVADATIDAATFASAAITATTIATDAIGAAELATDAGTELGTANWATTTRILTAGTNIALAKGTGVTGFNDLSAAQVNTEADAALADIYLDRLFAIDYNPASKPGTSTALLNELVESDGGVSRFTANTLELGPSGSGASVTAIADEVQTRTIAGVTTVGTVNALAANSVNAAAISSDAITEISAGLRDVVVDDISGKSLGCIAAAMGAYIGGQVTTSGGVSTYRDQSGVEVRISGTVTSSGNRTATITCPSY
jgi:hypothetical protein